jgi:hypothetical protein
MRPTKVVASVLSVSLAPWLLAEFAYVYIRQRDGELAARNVVGSPMFFFWAVLILALATAWVAFAQLLRYGSAAAVIGAVVAFTVGAGLFGVLTYVLMAAVHMGVFGGAL